MPANRRPNASPAADLPSSSAARVRSAAVAAIAFWLLSGLARGQDRGKWSAGVRFDHLSLEEGLAQSRVNSIAQTEEGLIWLATANGLYLYDGHRFERAGGDAMGRRAVTVLHSGQDGVLWAATFGGGVFRYLPVSGEVTELRHGCPAAGGVRALLEDRARVLWSACHDGSLLALERGRPLAVPVLAGADGSPVRGAEALLESADGTLWIGTDDGELLGWDAADRLRSASSPRRPRVREELPSGVSALTEDRAGDLWVATVAAGVYRWRRNAPGGPQPVAGLETVRAWTLLVDGTDTLWAGSRAGLFARPPPPRPVQVFRRDPLDPLSLSDDDIQSLFEDRSGLLWIGTTSGGVERYDRHQHRFHLWRHRPGDAASLAHDFVWAVAESADGTLWVGTAGGGLDRLDPAGGGFRHYRHDPADPAALGNDEVTALLVDATGAVWAGTSDGGLNRLDPATDRFVHYPPSLGDEAGPPGSITSVLEDASGTLWVATGRGGLGRLADRGTGRFERVDVCRHFDGPKAPCPVLDLVEDEDGHLWAVVYGRGLLALTAGDRRLLAVVRAEPGGLPDDQVIAVRRGADGRLWLGGGSGWIGSLDPRTRRFTPLDWQHGGEEVTVYSLLEEPDHRRASGRGAEVLWAGTSRGLWRIDLATGRVRRYDPRDGLQGFEFNAHAAHRSERTGELYFGGIGGLNRFHPDRLEDGPPPSVVLTSVSTPDGELYSGAQAATLRHLEIGPEHRSLTVEFAALDYRNPARHRFRYRLEGQDDGWIEAADRRHATFTNLPGGRYRLLVAGAGSDGVWSREPLSLALRVHPPYWQTWWFRGGLVAMLVTSGAAAATLLSRRSLRRAEQRRQDELEQRRRLLVAREQERGRLARELHDGPLQDLHALRLSGDPSLAPALPTLGGVIGELRRLCGELRPMARPSAGLAASLRALAQRFAESEPGVDLRLDLRDEGRDLPPTAGLHLYRICQEALSNVARHSGAAEVEVRFERDAEGLVLAVSDDGRGFAVPKRWIDLPGHERYGLLGIAERVEALRGRLAVRSAPGAGTELRVEVPLP